VWGELGEREEGGGGKFGVGCGGRGGGLEGGGKGGGGGGGGGGGELVQITGAQQSATGPEARLWRTCIFRGSIVECTN